MSNWSILTPIDDIFPPNSQNGIKADGESLLFFSTIWTGRLIFVKSKNVNKIKCTLSNYKIPSVFKSLTVFCSSINDTFLVLPGKIL